MLYIPHQLNINARYETYQAVLDYIHVHVHVHAINCNAVVILIGVSMKSNKFDIFIPGKVTIHH